MQDFRKLEIWNLAKNLSIEIYKITSSFPETEKFGLVSQIRRSSIGIASNIAEGCGRSTNKDFRNFLNITIGGLNELATQIEISSDLNLIDQDRSKDLKQRINILTKKVISFRKVIR